MNTVKKSAENNVKRFVPYVVAIVLAAVSQLAWGQEPISKPFVLRPVSPSAREPALPSAGYLTITQQRLATQGLPADRSLGNGHLMPQPLEPVPADSPGRSPVSGTVAPSYMRPHETIYIDQNGRILHPSHVYKSGRVHRASPSGKSAGTNNQKKKTPPRPKIDYSLAPIQPAIRPRLNVKDAPPKAVTSKTRVVDAAPLFRQEEVVSADRPQRKAAAKPSPATSVNNTRWLSGVRRLMDGNRSAASKSHDAKCPKCGNRKSHATVASKPSSSVRK